MKFKIKILLAFLLMTSLSLLSAQTIVGKVINGDSKEPVAFANVSFVNSTRGTVTNVDGDFQLVVRDSVREKTLIISHLGYVDLRVAIEDLDKPDLLFTLDFLGYDLPTVIVSDFSATSMVQDALDKIEQNYPQKKHLLTGFYNEQLVHQDGRLFTYGEGLVENIKKKYKSNPKQRSNASLDPDGDVGLVKGFYEDFHFLVENDFGEKFMFPAITGGGTMPHSLDVLKSSLSFLMKGEVDNYNFAFSGVAFDGDHEAWVISFKPKSTAGSFIGELVIDEKTRAILSSTFTLTPTALLAYNRSHSEIQLRHREYSVEYKKQRRWFTLQQCNVVSTFIHTAASDTLYNALNFTTTNRQFEGKFRIRRSDRIGLDDSMDDYVPDDGDYWEKEDVIVRSDLVKKALAEKQERIALIGSVDFMDDSFPAVKERAINEEKLILVAVTSPSCKPCQQIDKVTFTHPNFISAIDSGYIAYKMDMGLERDREEMARLKISDAPGLIVLSPWGHILMEYQGGLNPVGLANLLGMTTTQLKVGDVIAQVLALQNDEIGEVPLSAELLLKNADGSELIYRELLLITALGDESTWDSKRKQGLIFDHGNLLVDDAYQNYFLEHMPDYQKLYPTDKLNEKIYDISLYKYPVSEYGLRRIKNFLKENLLSDHEKYNSLLTIEYFTYFQPDGELKIDAQINYIKSFTDQSWDAVKSVILDMILQAEYTDQLDKVQSLLDDYRSVSIEYEWLDLRSLLLYQKGEQKAALNLIAEVMVLARENGVNYQPSIYLLRE